MGEGTVNNEKYFLKSERLGFRRVVETDLGDLYEMFGNPEVMKHYPEVYSVEKVEGWIQRTLERYERDGYSIWAVELLSAGEFVGGIGLAAQEVEGAKFSEIGYMLKRSFWGRGYAAEAALAVRDYAFNILNKQELISIVSPENEPSIKVAIKSGMKQVREIDFHGAPHLIFRIEKNDL